MINYGYLEFNYLEQQYLTSFALEHLGCQALVRIDASKFLANQYEVKVINFTSSFGEQFEANILDKQDAKAFQVNVLIEGVQKYIACQFLFNIQGNVEELASQATAQIVDEKYYLASQANFKIKDSLYYSDSQILSNIIDYKKSSGAQINVKYIDKLSALAQQIRIDKYPSKQCQYYLLDPYLQNVYMADRWCLLFGAQTNVQIYDYQAFGAQAQVKIIDRLHALAHQVTVKIVDKLNAIGCQVDVQKLLSAAMQFLLSLYNTNNLRILSEFPSRGIVQNNWTTNSQASGDFDVNNVNTDIVEQVYRSTQKTGVQLICDTGVPQGVYLDTFAMLNHNLTRGAVVYLIGSNTSDFSVTAPPIRIYVFSNNTFYIAPTLPNIAYRYWKITIDDISNPDGYIQIGTIIFGAARIFHGECFVDEIEFEQKDFTNTVYTEGHTNVAISRAFKRKIRLQFRMLKASGHNFQILRDIFENYRTTHKCLWIPTPDVIDGRITERFAVFGKLSQVPTEQHKSMGKYDNYVTLSIEIDESL